MYDDDFYREEGRVARESAQVVLPWLFAKHPYIESVIDVGCGTGEWAHIADVHGRLAIGVDHNIPKELIVAPNYLDVDLSGPHLGAAWRMDLAICLEVAEHLPADSAAPLVAGLAKAGRVLFSAATPGQPGINHINCQPHTYWHCLFAEHGMTPTHIGPLFTEPVADFYRRNMFLYEHS